MLLEEFGQRQGVIADAVHAQGQRFDPLQDQKGVHRRKRRPLVAQRHHAGTPDIRGRAERFGVDHAVIADVGLIQAHKALTVLRPGELAAIDDRPTHAVAVAAQVFGERVHDDISTVFDRTQQVGAGYGVVHNQRNARCVRNLGECFDIGHVAKRIADRFAENCLGAVVDQRGKGLGLARIGEAHGNALLREGMGKQVVGTAIQRGGRHDVVARLGDRLDRVGDCCHARSDGQCSDTTFKCGDALFQHVGGRVHDAGVDVALHLQVEQIGTVLGTVKRIGHRLVDRNSNRLGGRVGGVAGVHGQGFDLHGLPRVVVNLELSPDYRGRRSIE